MPTDASSSWAPRTVGYLGFGAVLLWLSLFGSMLDRLTLATWGVSGLVWVVVGACSLVGAALALKGWGARVGRRGTVDAACAVGLALCPLMLVAAGPWAWCVCALLLTGPCATWLLLRWGAMLAKLDGPAALRVVALNAACYFVAKALVGALAGEGVDAVGVLTVLLGPLSAVGLRASAAVPGSRGHAFYTAENARSLAGIFVFMALFSVVLVLLDVLTWGVDRGVLAYLIAALVFMAVAVWVFVCKRPLDFYTNVRTLLVATACGAVLCVAFLGVARECSAGFIMGIRELTRFYLFLLQADLARHSKVSSAVVFGLGWACCGIPRLPLCWVNERSVEGLTFGDGGYQTLTLVGKVSSAVVFGLGWACCGIPRLPLCWVNERSVEGLTFGDGGYQTLTLVVLLFLLVIIMGYSLIKMPPGLRPPFSTMSLPVAAEGEPGAVTGGVSAACDALAQAHDLTAREAQILGYLCAGRSRGYIADTLYISENTVKFHTKNVYRKLGVTSKQELIDLCGKG